MQYQVTTYYKGTINIEAKNKKELEEKIKVTPLKVKEITSKREIKIIR